MRGMASEGAEADMEHDRAQTPDAAAGGDPSGVASDGWLEADDSFGDEAAFPSIWQQLDGADSATLD